jgi:dihydroorotate dehydrogenase
VLSAIYTLRMQGVTAPIFGSGGVMTAADAAEYLCVGANAVQIYSVLHANDGAVAEIVAGIADMLAGRPVNAIVGRSLQQEEEDDART